VNGADQTETEADQTMVLSLQNGHETTPDRTFADHDWAGDFTDEHERAIFDLTAGLTSLGYIRSALRRMLWLWCLFALVGLIGGLGVLAKFPPAYQATTSLLLSNSYSGAIQDDQAIAQSRTVAGAALQLLGLHESAASFAGHYTAVAVTGRVMAITVKATSSELAVREANAVATAVLDFQSHLLKTQAQVIDASFQQEVNAAKHRVSLISSQISDLSAQRDTPARQARMSGLQAAHTQATNALAVLEQTVNGDEAVNQTAITQAVHGSQVLDKATPIIHSRKRSLVLYAGGGLLAGLLIGLSIVILSSLVSNKLRRRDDVARALGSPVRLSVNRARLIRWLPGRRAERRPEIRRIVAHLGSLIQPAAAGPASLAVVPVDDVRVPAICLMSLATLCAEQGLKVVVADLCSGAPAARLVGESEPGVRTAGAQGAQLVVSIRRHDDAVPVGPLGSSSLGRHAAQLLADACAGADLLLTLIDLDPSLGAEHLAGWATGAVAMVTTGQSSAQRVHAVGEMIRLADVDFPSAVLVGADKTDESLGVAFTPEVSGDADADVIVEGLLQARGVSLSIPAQPKPKFGWVRSRSTA
jgi:capsular polysaccharide biosynthesis protein